MLFNSLNYLIFFPVVFMLYWWLNNKSLKWQNIMLLIVSYYFYSCWDWRFVFLLVFSTGLDCFSGIITHEAKIKSKKKIWLLLDIGINLRFHRFFKCYNFFKDSFGVVLKNTGFKVHYSTIIC